MEITYVRKCRRCGVIKPLERFHAIRGARIRACYECQWMRTPGYITLPRALVLTEKGRAALREMAA